MAALMGGQESKRPESRIDTRLLAETQGFEPWIQVLPRCALSRGVPSTTRPRLRNGDELRARGRLQGAKYTRIVIPRSLASRKSRRPRYGALELIRK